MSKRLTKADIGQAMLHLERHQDINAANTAAALLGKSVKCLEQDRSLIQYDGIMYASLAEAIDDLLVDLGSRKRGLYLTH